jgi:hypothetical protein
MEHQVINTETPQRVGHMGPIISLRYNLHCQRERTDTTGETEVFKGESTREWGWDPSASGENYCAAAGIHPVEGVPVPQNIRENPRLQHFPACWLGYLQFIQSGDCSTSSGPANYYYSNEILK